MAQAGTVAAPGYDANGELAAASYPSGVGLGANGTALAIGRDPVGRGTHLSWTGPAGTAIADDAVNRSQSGKVIDESIDTVDPHAGANFTYDAVGRLRSASVAGHDLVYAGAKRGATLVYDPFGTALTPTSTTSPDGVPDNSAGNFDYGWQGQAQRGLEHAPGIATIEMGARPYVPGTGRFLSVALWRGGRRSVRLHEWRPGATGRGCPRMPAASAG